MDEKYWDQASDLEQHRRDQGLVKARLALQGPGSDECEDCGEDIPQERRRAMPSSFRCIRCQTIFEETDAQ